MPTKLEKTTCKKEERVECRFKFGPSYEDQERGLGTHPVMSRRLKEVFDYLLKGTVITVEEAQFLLNPLQSGDYFRVCADFDDYVEAQQRMETVWRDKEEWTTRSIMTVSGMGKFSSDNAYEREWISTCRIAQYCRYVWNVSPIEETRSEIKRTRSFPRLSSLPKELLFYH